MRPLIDVSNDQELMNYSRIIIDEFTPSHNPLYTYDLRNWTFINYYRRDRNHLPAWQVSILHVSYVIGWFILAFAIILKSPLIIFGCAFTMISTTLILYVSEFIWKERFLDGYVKWISIPTNEFIPKLADILDRSGYSCEERIYRKSEIREKPIVLIINHNGNIVLIVAWNYKENSIVHLGRYPSNNWDEIHSLKNLLDSINFEKINSAANFDGLYKPQSRLLKNDSHSSSFQDLPEKAEGIQTKERAGRV